MNIQYWSNVLYKYHGNTSLLCQIIYIITSLIFKNFEKKPSAVIQMLHYCRKTNNKDKYYDTKQTPRAAYKICHFTMIFQLYIIRIMSKRCKYIAVNQENHMHGVGACPFYLLVLFLSPDKEHSAICWQQDSKTNDIQGLFKSSFVPCPFPQIDLSPLHIFSSAYECAKNRKRIISYSCWYTTEWFINLMSWKFAIYLVAYKCKQKA